MIGTFQELIGKRRPETIFLPSIVYGYIYVNHDSLGPCIDQGSLGFPPVIFLVLAGISAIAAASLYIILRYLESQGVSREDREEVVDQIKNQPRYKRRLIGVAVVYIALFAGSVGELVVRWCRQDEILIAISLFYIVLGAMIVSEHFFSGLEIE